MALNWKGVARDVGIVFVLTFLGGLVVGLTSGLTGAEVNVIAIALSNIVFGTVGFTISGCIVKINRFRHLYQVLHGGQTHQLPYPRFPFQAATVRTWSGVGSFDHQLLARVVQQHDVAKCGLQASDHSLGKRT